MVWVWVVLGIVALAVGVGAGYAVWLYRRARALFVELEVLARQAEELADLLAQIDFDGLARAAESAGAAASARA